MTEELRKKYAQDIAMSSLSIGAIKLSPKKPIIWASGYPMPIYNDNRMFLGHPMFWKEVLNILKINIEIIENIEISKRFDVIAGTSTAGIPHAAMIANPLSPLAYKMIYVRNEPKGHGLENQIEGIDVEKGLEGQRVVLIEDLISTGKSSVKAVQAIRDANGICDHCISIFNYGFDKPKKMFAGEESFGDKDNPRFLDKPCKVISLLTYDILIETAKKNSYIDDADLKMLESWNSDPFNWAEKNGFKK